MPPVIPSDTRKARIDIATHHREAGKSLCNTVWPPARPGRTFGLSRHEEDSPFHKIALGNPTCNVERHPPCRLGLGRIKRRPPQRRGSGRLLVRVQAQCWRSLQMLMIATYPPRRLPRDADQEGFYWADRVARRLVRLSQSPSNTGSISTNCQYRGCQPCALGHHVNGASLHYILILARLLRRCVV